MIPWRMARTQQQVAQLVSDYASQKVVHDGHIMLSGERLYGAEVSIYDLAVVRETRESSAHDLLAVPEASTKFGSIDSPASHVFQAISTLID